MALADATTRNVEDDDCFRKKSSDTRRKVSREIKEISENRHQQRSFNPFVKTLGNVNLLVCRNFRLFLLRLSIVQVQLKLLKEREPLTAIITTNCN
jgi:hypothetical protein